MEEQGNAGVSKNVVKILFIQVLPAPAPSVPVRLQRSQSVLSIREWLRIFNCTEEQVAAATGQGRAGLGQERNCKEIKRLSPHGGECRQWWHSSCGMAPAKSQNPERNAIRVKEFFDGAWRVTDFEEEDARRGGEVRAHGILCGKSLACTWRAISSSCAERRSDSSFWAMARRCDSTLSVSSSKPARPNEFPSTSSNRVKIPPHTGFCGGE